MSFPYDSGVVYSHSSQSDGAASKFINQVASRRQEGTGQDDGNSSSNAVLLLVPISIAVICVLVISLVIHWCVRRGKQTKSINHQEPSLGSDNMSKSADGSTSEDPEEKSDDNTWLKNSCQIGSSSASTSSNDSNGSGKATGKLPVHIQH